MIGVISLLVAATLTAPAGATSAAQGGDRLLPGEALSPAELDVALASMDPIERAGREAAFRDRSRPIVAYTREVFAAPAEMRGNGRRTDVTIGSNVNSANITLSVSVAWETDCLVQLSVCWLVTSYFNWDNVALDWSGREWIATSWANNLAIGGRAAVGYYQNGDFVSFYNRDDQPNAGTGIAFDEWKFLSRSSTTYADYGWDYVTIGESSRQWQATNVVFRYFHTCQSLDYSLTFGVPPSVSISPTTATWSKSALATFTN